jgi:hypothetical protein
MCVYVQQLVLGAKAMQSKLEILEARANDIKDSTPKDEQLKIFAQVNDMKRRWESLQGLMQAKTQELKEVGDLWDSYEDSAQRLTEMIEGGFAVVKSKVYRTSAEDIQDAITQQKVRSNCIICLPVTWCCFFSRMS